MDLTEVRTAFKGLWRSIWNEDAAKEVVAQCEDFIAIGERAYAILRLSDGAKRLDQLLASDVWYPDQAAAEKIADAANSEGEDEAADEADDEQAAA